jgi:CheY-like chemotaxis protein
LLRRHTSKVCRNSPKLKDSILGVPIPDAAKGIEHGDLMEPVFLQSGDIAQQKANVRYVMLVEDDPNSAREIKSILDRAGFDTKVLKDGGQVQGAISIDRPDMVILKLILPGESGFEICERLKKQDRFLPVLIYTEISLRASQELASKLGADGYLTKPCSPELLVKTILDVADAVWERLNEEKDDTKKGEIRFRCKCGHRIKKKLKDRGKLVTCSKCQAMVQVPERSAHEMIFRAGDDAQNNQLDDPMRFLSVKCQHCGTFYKLFSNDLERARTCPRCQQRQRGALSIIGAPLSRAALASSLRVLRILSGELKGKKMMLPDCEVTLGTDRSCQLRQTGEGIAPRHCTLKPTPLGILVNDLGSETGTFIDNRPISGESLLEPGGLLRVGSAVFRLVGQNRDVRATRFFDLKTAKIEQQAAEKGVKLLMSEKSTAEEAAEVIQAHWDIVRKKLAMQAHAESPHE